MSQEGQKDSVALIGTNDLKDFRLVQMFEVSDTDEDGRKRTVLGVVENEELAMEWSAIQKASWHPNIVRRILVLTNGEYAYIVMPTQVHVISDEKARAEVVSKALDRLSPGQRKIIGV